MADPIPLVPAADLKFLLDHLSHKPKPQRNLLPQLTGQPQFLQNKGIHNDLLLRFRQTSFCQCDKHIRQCVRLRQIADFRLSFHEIICRADKNVIAALLHKRICDDLLILFPRRRLQPGVKFPTDLPHGMLLCHLHGPADQRKSRRKEDTRQDDRQHRKEIPHTIISQAAIRQPADGCTVVVSHERTSPSPPADVGCFVFIIEAAFPEAFRTAG